jgi:hypothetical protein
VSAISRLARLKGEQKISSAFPNIKDDNQFFLPGVILRPWYHYISSIFPAMDLNEIILNHTLWRYYEPFMPFAVKAVPSSEGWGAYYNKRLQWLPRRQLRIRHAQYWRWCTDCAEADLDDVGVAYWHCSHQIPAVTHCAIHHKILVGSCSGCGYSIKTLQPNLKPSISSGCPSCGKQLSEAIPKDEHGLVNWLNTTSLDIFNVRSDFDWRQYKSSIITEHGLKFGAPPLSVSERLHCSSKRKILESGLDKSVVDWLFNLPFNHQSSLINPAIDLKILFSEQLYPPLTYLMILWVLHVKGLGDHRFNSQDSVYALS